MPPAITSSRYVPPAHAQLNSTSQSTLSLPTALNFHSPNALVGAGLHRAHIFILLSQFSSSLISGSSAHTISPNKPSSRSSSLVLGGSPALISTRLQPPSLVLTI